MQCFLGLSLWLHAGRGRSAKLNVVFCDCWQQRWWCAIGMCHCTLVWWLNKANRQCRQGERDQRKGKAEWRQKRSRNSDGVGQKGLNILASEEYVFKQKKKKEKYHISLWKVEIIFEKVRLLYIWQNVFTFAQIVLAKQVTVWLEWLLSLNNSNTSSNR